MKLFTNQKGKYVLISVYGKNRRIYLPDMLKAVNKERSRLKKSTYTHIPEKKLVKTFEKIYNKRKSIGKPKTKAKPAKARPRKVRKDKAPKIKSQEKKPIVFEIAADKARIITDRQKRIIAQEETLKTLKEEREKSEALDEIDKLKSSRAMDAIKESYSTAIFDLVINPKTSLMPSNLTNSLNASVRSVFNKIEDLNNSNKYYPANKLYIAQEFQKRGEANYVNVYNHFINKAKRPGKLPGMFMGYMERHGLSKTEIASLPLMTGNNEANLNWFKLPKLLNEPIKDYQELPEYKPRELKSEEGKEKKEYPQFRAQNNEEGKELYNIYKAEHDEKIKRQRQDEDRRALQDKIDNKRKQVEDDKKDYDSTEYKRLREEKDEQDKKDKFIKDKQDEENRRIIDAENLRIRNLSQKRRNAEDIKKSLEQYGDGIAKRLGIKYDAPLNTTVINEIMKPYTKSGFIGCLAADQFMPEFRRTLFKRGSAIINLDPISEAGTHWVACMWEFRDGHPATIEYYNSLADQTENMDDFREMVDLIDPAQRVKVKTNSSQDQKNDTNSCGYFAIKFLIDRYRGKSFKQATNYTEKDINKYKHTFNYV